MPARAARAAKAPTAIPAVALVVSAPPWPFPDEPESDEFPPEPGELSGSVEIVGFDLPGGTYVSLLTVWLKIYAKLSDSQASSGCVSCAPPEDLRV